MVVQGFYEEVVIKGILGVMRLQLIWFIGVRSRLATVSPEPYTLTSVNEAQPQGSKDLNNRVLGPKYYNMNGIWGLKPDYLGPWTLRARQKVKRQVWGCYSVGIWGC